MEKWGGTPTSTQGARVCACVRVRMRVRVRVHVRVCVYVCVCVRVAYRRGDCPLEVVEQAAVV